MLGEGRTGRCPRQQTSGSSKTDLQKENHVPAAHSPQPHFEFDPPALGQSQEQGLAGLGVGLQGSLALPVRRRWRKTH